MILFKYLSPAGAFKVLENKEYMDIRFGLPKAYNDPYELFLQTDKALKSDEERAFFEHLLGKIPQLPVSCFSRVPNSVALWAHYATEHSGICLGFDEEYLTNQFPIVYVGDVKYSDEPAQIKADLLEYAFQTGKRRHVLTVLEMAYRSAYFVKRSEWQYECERRLVVSPDDVQAKDTYFTARVRMKPLRLVIVGSGVELSLRQFCETRAEENGIPVYELRNGKRSYEPFFVHLDGSRVLRWAGSEFHEIKALCPECREPGATTDGGKCIWCKIDPHTRREAALSNLLSVSLALGIEQELPVAFYGLSPKGFRTKKK